MDGMPTEPPPLPDVFDVVHGRRMAAAHEAGDRDGVERARRYIVAEGSVSPEEAAHLDQFTRAMALVQDMIAARGTARADELARQIRQEFSPEIVRQVHTGMLFSAGRQQGWLPERDYDTLAAAVSSAGAEVTEQMRYIKRGKPA